MLAAGLAAIAAQPDPPPPELEKSVLEAYRRSREVTTATARNSGPGQALSNSRRQIAAAATVAVAMVLASLYLIQGRRERPFTPSESAQKVRLTVESPPVTTRPLVTFPMGPGLETGKDRALRQDTVTPKSRAAYRPRRQSRPAETANAEPSGTATDFLPVTYVGNLQDFGSLQIVRARVPRATMVSFGLPISQERADSPVAADMLISPDGVVRAIRFVR
jgi:hypothetical protein